MSEVVIYFDYRSPGAYFADRFLEMRRLTRSRWVPVSLLHLSGYGDRPMGFNDPRRARYTQQDLVRSSERLQLPFKVPEFVLRVAQNTAGAVYGRDHPIDSHLALRGACVAQQRNKLVAYNRAVFEALWVENKAIDQEVVIATIAERIGEDADKFLKRVRGAQAEETLLENTQQADQAGVFELPTFMIDNRMVCGYDRIDVVEFEMRKSIDQK